VVNPLQVLARIKPTAVPWSLTRVQMFGVSREAHIIAGIELLVCNPQLVQIDIGGS